jgi:cysteine dioxygenase
MFIDRLARSFPPGGKYDAGALKRQVVSIDATMEDVAQYLSAPEGKPYGRQLLYSNDGIEVIVMNWNPGQPCLPHDHGASAGWVQVLSGAVEHALCRNDASGMPAPVHATVELPGSLIHASTGMVHMMRALPDSGPTVTLHFYSPPITGMRVFDPENGAACIVSDDCGAWWPSDEQLVKLLRAPAPALDER